MTATLLRVWLRNSQNLYKSIRIISYYIKNMMKGCHY